MSLESPASAALPRFNVRPCVADGGFAFGGVLMLAAALILAGAAMGLAAHFISRFIYLIIVFPVAIGLGVGAVGMRMVKAGRVRNAFIGGVTGFLAGVLAMAMMHYFDYQYYKAKAPRILVDLAKMPPTQREQAMKIVLALVPPEDRKLATMELRAMNGFWAFMDYSATRGVSIKSTHSYSSKARCASALPPAISASRRATSMSSSTR